MAPVDTYVWHDLDGNITAVGYATGGKTENIRPAARDNRQVLKVSVAKRELARLHLTHRVDVERATLSRRKDDKTASAE